MFEVGNIYMTQAQCRVSLRFVTYNLLQVVMPPLADFRYMWT